MTDIVSFWTGGPLTPYEQLALRSFARRGHTVKLYTYETSLAAPPGVELQDAREALPLGGLAQELIRNRAFALLSDVVRYLLLDSGPSGRTWVDADVVLLADRLPTSEYLFAYEDGHYINGAVLRIPREGDLLRQLLKMVEQMNPGEAITAPWGTYGPRVITQLVKALGLEPLALQPQSVYPIHYSQTWRLFDPASVSWCREAVSESFGLHIWNSYIARAGFRERTPPRGSFLAELFDINEIECDAQPIRRSEIRKWAPQIDATRRSSSYRAKKRFRKFRKRRIRPINERIRSLLRPVKRAFVDGSASRTVQ